MINILDILKEFYKSNNKIRIMRIIDDKFYNFEKIIKIYKNIKIINVIYHPSDKIFSRGRVILMTKYFTFIFIVLLKKEILKNMIFRLFY